MPDRDPRIADMVAYALDKKPLEFQKTFVDLATEKIAAAVDARKAEVAQAMFAPPATEPTPDPEEDEEEDEQTA